MNATDQREAIRDAMKIWNLLGECLKTAQSDLEHARMALAVAHSHASALGMNDFNIDYASTFEVLENVRSELRRFGREES